MLFVWCINFPFWFVITGTIRREREQGVVKLTQCRNCCFPEDTFSTRLSWCHKGPMTGEQQRIQKAQPGQRWHSGTESALEEVSLATKSWDQIQVSHQLGWQGLPWHTCSKLAGSGGEEWEVDGGHCRDGSIAGRSVCCQGSHSCPGFCLAARRRVTIMVSGLQNLLQNPPGAPPFPSVCSCWSHANKTVPAHTTITSVCSADMLTVFQIRHLGLISHLSVKLFCMFWHLLAVRTSFLQSTLFICSNLIFLFLIDFPDLITQQYLINREQQLNNVAVLSRRTNTKNLKTMKRICLKLSLQSSILYIKHPGHHALCWGAEGGHSPGPVVTRRISCQLGQQCWQMVRDACQY